LSDQKFSFSIQEAETLGAECAIVLSATKGLDILDLGRETIVEHLQDVLTFLSKDVITNHLQRLIDLKLIRLGGSKQELVRKEPSYKLKLPSGSQSSGKKMLDPEWVPSRQANEVLEMGGVESVFIKSKVGEFRMYWLEKNQSRDNWNVLFCAFIRREWVKENSSNKGLPTTIYDQWTPSTDAFDILELANVSKDAAVKHLKEFILYWKENGTALLSWNSKFVDFVKRKELIGSYTENNGKKNIKHNGPGEFTEEFSKRTKDASWAETLEL